VEDHHPWQLFPGQLIGYACNHLRRSSEFDQIVGFLLLDVGVETLLKVFLLLPGEVTGTNMSYSARKQATEGSFHDLVRGVEKATRTARGRLRGIDLGHVEYFHSLRNKLYHAGNGITVQGEHAERYAELALELLERLLEVPLKSSLSAESCRESELEDLSEKLEQARASLKTAVCALGHDLRLAIEKVEPAFLMPSFELWIDSWDVDRASVVLLNDPQFYDQVTLLEARKELSEDCTVVADEDGMKAVRLRSDRLRSMMPAPLRRFADEHHVDPGTVARFLRASDITEFLLVVAEVAFELPGGPVEDVYALARLKCGPLPPFPGDDSLEDHLRGALQEVESLTARV